MTPLRLLIIEDSADDAELLVRQLTKGGYQVRSRRVDSEAALGAALDEPWDVAISDYAMPGFDGLRAAAMVKERDLDLPFIFVSGVIGEDRAISAMKTGVRDYIPKHNLARLVPAVRRELGEAHDRDRRRAAERALAVEGARYRSIFQSALVGLAEMDLSSVGQWLQTRPPEACADLGAYLTRHPAAAAEAASRIEVLQVNDAMREMVGARSTEALFERMAELYGPEVAATWGDILATFARGETSYRGETVVTGLEGQRRNFLITLRRQREHELSAVVLSVLDVTEQRQLQSQFHAAQRMEAVGRLAGGVAHDFNNLLTAIQAGVDFLRDGLPPGRGDAELDMIETASTRAAALTDQLLAFSRRRIQQPKVLDLNAVVGGLEKMLGRIIGEDIELVTRFGARAGRVLADQGHIEQIIMNLAVNARDAMENGGRLVLETANVVLEHGHVLDKPAVVPPGRYVVMSVSDTGVGMDAETQSKIFEPFFTTKGPGRGTGLGLATVYGSVKQLGGFVWCYSEVGQGTSFKIYLPATEDAASRAAHLEPVARKAHGSETVLLVEDQDMVRRVARRILAGAGYQVLEARDGREALDLAEQHDGIDLVLTDVIMPDMNGRDLYDRLCERRPGLAVLYMSGYTENTIAQHHVIEPGTHFLEKPFTPTVLLQKVRETLDVES